MTSTKLTSWAGRSFVTVAMRFSRPVCPTKITEARQLQAELQSALAGAGDTTDPILILEAEILLRLLETLVKWMEPPGM